MALFGSFLGLFARATRSFPARVFGYMVVPLAVCGTLLTALFVQSQSRLLEDQLRREGMIIAELLAHDVRVGVFAENESILDDVIGAAARRSEVVEVAVFSAAPKLLLHRDGSAPKPSGFLAVGTQGASRALARAPATYVSDERASLTFWAPVILQAPTETLDELYFPDPANFRDRVGGLVAVTISKRALEESRRSIVRRSLVGAAILLAVTGLVTALALREAAKPLARLLQQARDVASTTVTEENDLGLLSDTFGHLVASLRDALARVAQLTAGLERDVAQRTRELVEANTELTRARDHLEERIRERTLALEMAHRQLLHAEKLSAVGRISASFAHEINNPIFAIRSVVETLCSASSLDPQHVELARAAIDECNRVAKLIRDLQGFNRPTSREPSAVQLDQVLDSVLLLCRKELSVNKVSVRTSYAANLPAVLAIPDQLKQVFLNLCTNAIDAMAETGGTLTISTEATESDVLVRFADTGPGIAEEHHRQIFDPFFTTKSEIKGTGLGLSISLQIIESHKGSIHVDSRPGEGAVFTVRLPRPTGATT